MVYMCTFAIRKYPIFLEKSLQYERFLINFLGLKPAMSLSTLRRVKFYNEISAIWCDFFVQANSRLTVF